ncbi:MAG: dihydrolipoamide acetyltransferase family protein [Anaerolineaceae bacterium]|nr:dihydrolipoamide acetyltransferase family protein [Anaerolineaceae bacterium]
MSHAIIMPRFGATMEEGTINSWLIKEGDHFSKGDVLGEIAIEKLSNELLAEEDGVVVKIVAGEGATIPCGGTILIVGALGETAESLESASPPPAKAAAPAAPIRANEPAGLFGSRQAVAVYSASTAIAPKALQLAQELGVDYHYIQGTGRFGMVTRDDIRKAVASGAAPQAAQPAGLPAIPAELSTETHTMTQMQSAIARAMGDSLRNSAQTTITMDADASNLVSTYKAHKDEYAGKGQKLTYTAILIKVVALALVEHKLLRTVIDGSTLVTRNEINIGVAVDLPEGLVVPNIKAAHQKSISQITAELEDLGNRARSGKLSPDEMSGGTFTISNLGALGIKYFTPVLNPGESALLGIGTITEVPYVKDGGIFIKPILYLSLTHDHRVVNGAPGARFLQTLQQIMNYCEILFKD